MFEITLKCIFQITLQPGKEGGGVHHHRGMGKSILAILKQIQGNCTCEGALYLRFLFALVLRIDMYVGGTDDLMGFILMFPFLSAEDKEKQRAFIVQKATSRYFPVYEKVCRRIIFFPDSGGITVGTLVFHHNQKQKRQCSTLHQDIHTVCWLEMGQSSIRQVGVGQPKSLSMYFLPHAQVRKGVNRAALMGTWCPASAN